MTTMTPHPYFTAMAEQVFNKAGGDPANAGPLAEWAEQQADARKARLTTPEEEWAPLPGSVLVAEDGSLVAEAQRFPKNPSHTDVPALYITRVLHPDLQPDGEGRAPLIDREAGLAVGEAARRLGQSVIEVRGGDLRGASPRAARDGA